MQIELAMPGMLATAGWLCSAPRKASAYLLCACLALSLAGALVSGVATSWPVAPTDMPYSDMVCSNQTSFDEYHQW